MRRAAVEVEPLGQGASERMLERSGGEPTAPVSGTSGDASSQTQTESMSGNNPVDPEIVERSR